MMGMKRLVSVLVPLVLLALACGEADAPSEQLPPAIKAMAQAVVAETQAADQTASRPDTESTITAAVQATVRALINATPIPSPTPTEGIPAPTIQPTSFTTRQGGSFNTSPTPTAIRFPTRTPLPTAVVTPRPTRLTLCAAAADGVEVSAWVNGRLAATTQVEFGSYTLLVEQPSGASFTDQLISFKVGSSDAKQSVRWTQGGATELALSAPGVPLSRFTPNGPGPSFLAGGLLAQPLPPHVVLGTVFVGAC